jgi:hypothetical protein
MTRDIGLMCGTTKEIAKMNGFAWRARRIVRPDTQAQIYGYLHASIEHAASETERDSYESVLVIRSDRPEPESQKACSLSVGRVRCKLLLIVSL